MRCDSKREKLIVSIPMKAICRSTFVEIRGIAGEAKSQGSARHDRIVTIHQSGPASAFAKVECALPARFFVDYLALLKTKDGWRIVAQAVETETR
jgi:hypothetical protein